jgi:hypothetical protein
MAEDIDKHLPRFLAILPLEHHQHFPQLIRAVSELRFSSQLHLLTFVRSGLSGFRTEKQFRKSCPAASEKSPVSPTAPFHLQSTRIDGNQKYLGDLQCSPTAGVGGFSSAGGAATRDGEA